MRRLVVLVAVAVAAILLPAAAAAGTVAKAKPKVLMAEVTLTGKGFFRPEVDDEVLVAVHGTGTAILKLHTGTRKLCWSLTFKQIGKPTAAHVHQGAAGVPGPVVVTLGSQFQRTGCSAPLSAGLFKALRATPANYYIDIHTAKYPGGAIGGFWPGELEDLNA